MTKYSFETVIFDLDGVITKTARIHAKSWKQTFDEYLKFREKRNEEPFKEFLHDPDYLKYVDGKPRYQGVQSFLESRNIFLPFGDPSDSPEVETVCGIGNRKNVVFRKIIKTNDAEIFSSSIEFIHELKKSEIKVGIASSSKNCRLILESTGIESLFETRVDGEVSAQKKLRGKPEGDIFITAARNLNSVPEKTVVIEDAVSGVKAGRNGGFGLVIGIARKNNEKELLVNGADLVVKDLADISLKDIEEWFNRKIPYLFNYWEKSPPSIDPLKVKKGRVYYNSTSEKFHHKLLNNKKLAFFLDYDGTLTPIVSRPDLAVLSDDMRAIIQELSKKHITSIVSGRMRDDVENLVKIPGIFFAGSHGFDIKGPKVALVEPKAKQTIPVISRVIKRITQETKDIPGIFIEEKKFSVAVHYRLTDSSFVPRIRQHIENILRDENSIKMMEGKMVFEIMPDITWNKGMAIRWIMKALNLNWNEYLIVYIGDDVTDENAFRVTRTRGTGILVSTEARTSGADFFVRTPDEVKKVFEWILKTT